MSKSKPTGSWAVFEAYCADLHEKMSALLIAEMCSTELH